MSKETQPRTLGTITEAAKNRGTFSGSVDKQVAIGSDEDVP